jgi:hypothetical protein
MITYTSMPKSPRPDSNQLASLIVARAAGLPTPENLKKFDRLVKKMPRKVAKKPRK